MRHLSEAHSGDPELREVASGATVDGVAVKEDLQAFVESKHGKALSAVSSDSN